MKRELTFKEDGQGARSPRAARGHDEFSTPALRRKTRAKTKEFWLCA